MITYKQGFTGRERDLEKLNRLIEAGKTRVICIYGETGIGKTALANCLCEQADKECFPLYYRLLAFNPGLVEGLEDWFVSSLAKEVLSIPPLNATREELVDSILAFAAENNSLLLLDNVETLNQDWLTDFVQSWLKKATLSVLILTTTKELLLDSAVEPGYVSYPLKGFMEGEQEAILALMGPIVVSNPKFNKNQLLQAASQLGNSPQRLLYLRWLEPQDRKGLNHIVQFLRKDELTKNLDDTIQKRINGTVLHFLALGHVRTVEVEEALFAWLWEHLGGRSASTYIDVRDQLLHEGFLAYVGETGKVKLRINPSVHIQLEKLLVNRIGILHISHVDYLLAEYYRQRFEEYPAEPDLTLLSYYVYHAIQSKNLASALDYVMASPRIRTIHHMGRALGLRNILQLFDRHIDEHLKDITVELNRLGNDKATSEPAIGNRLRAEQIELSQFHIVVKVELAYCENDLSDHEKCLQFLDCAATMLKTYRHKSEVAIRLRINYLRGISFSCLGRSCECEEAYSRVIRDGIEHGMEKEAGIPILALGYLGFELRFHDISLAYEFGKKALELAESYEVPFIRAKNRCSLAETLFFDNQIEKAARYLREAEELCRHEKAGRSDRRELGRILIHQAVVQMAMDRFQDADRLLDEAEHINKESGDRRRIAASKAFRGINLWRQQEYAASKRLLLEALKQHYDVKDWRHIILEALTCAYMDGHHAQKKAIQVARDHNSAHYEEIWAKYLREACETEQMELYGNYWTSFYKPRLLE